jgi:hypothetical protein
MIEFLIAAAGASMAAPHTPDTCHGQPEAPPFTEYGHYVPGLGRATGRNDDFHDDLEDPLDVPGRVLSGAARGGEIQQLTSFVGLDCPIDADE